MNPDEQKRKRESSTSSKSSDSLNSPLTEVKRHKQSESFNADLDNSTDRMSSFENVNPGQSFGIHTSTPVGSHGNIHAAPMYGSSGLPQYDAGLLAGIGALLDHKLKQQKDDIVCEVTEILKTDIVELKGKVHDLEVENIDMKKRLDILEKERETARDNIQSAKQKSVENDQYARRNGMIVLGIVENNQEDLKAILLDTIKNKIKLQIKAEDIEIIHRIGTRTLGKNRPIIVRFRFRDTKYSVMSARKVLKNSGIVFAEDLCSELQSLQKEVSRHPGVQACWAWNGKIQAKNMAGKFFNIRFGSKWQVHFNPAEIAITRPIPTAPPNPGASSNLQPPITTVTATTGGQPLITTTANTTSGQPRFTAPVTTANGQHAYPIPLPNSTNDPSRPPSTMPPLESRPQMPNYMTSPLESGTKTSNRLNLSMPLLSYNPS